MINFRKPTICYKILYDNHLRQFCTAKWASAINGDLVNRTVYMDCDFLRNMLHKDDFFSPQSML